VTTAAELPWDDPVYVLAALVRSLEAQWPGVLRELDYHHEMGRTAPTWADIDIAGSRYRVRIEAMNGPGVPFVDDL